MNFRQVRKKAKTVQNVKKITNAMQMVSAVKMRKSQREALEGREYRAMLDEVISEVLSSKSMIKESKIPWIETTVGSRSLCILISSNKGLCGSFHSYLFKEVLDKQDLTTADFIVIGKKAAEFITRTRTKIIADFSSQIPFIDNVSAVFSVIEERYVSGQYSKVFVIYNKFITSFKNEPTIEKLLPITEIKQLDKENKEIRTAEADYLLEPSGSDLLKPLIDDYLKEKIRGAIRDSEAAEHSARMMAMKSATDNATELIFNLTLLGNKLRQTQITNELLDMVAATS